MRRFLALSAVVMLLVVAQLASAGGYVVILKNGHKIRCREPMELVGDNAHMTLVTGVLASYPVSQVDIIETQRYNQQGLGDAVEIEALSFAGTPVPTATPRISLGKYVSLDAMEKNPELGTVLVPTYTPTPGIRLHTYPYHDERVTRAFEKVFADEKLYLYHTSAGTNQEYFFVQAVTDSEEEVFHALETVCQAYYLIRKADETIAPDAVELQMIQTSRKPAGTFRITPDLATELVNKTVTIQQFYIRHVIF
jgi:hypothetical protein